MSIPFQRYRCSIRKSPRLSCHMLSRRFILSGLGILYGSVLSRRQRSPSMVTPNRAVCQWFRGISSKFYFWLCCGHKKSAPAPSYRTNRTVSPCISRSAGYCFCSVSGYTDKKARKAQLHICLLPVFLYYTTHRFPCLFVREIFILEICFPKNGAAAGSPVSR